MEMPTLNKKGQSLIEVVVALAILVTVFAGTITLIITIVDLNVAARQRTEAVAWAQKYLSEAVKKVEDGCVKKAASLVDPDGPPDPHPNYDITYGTVLGSYTGAGTEVSPYGFSYSGADYIRIYVKVIWKDKVGNTNEYTVVQIVGVDNE